MLFVRLYEAHLYLCCLLGCTVAVRTTTNAWLEKVPEEFLAVQSSHILFSLFFFSKKTCYFLNRLQKSLIFFSPCVRRLRFGLGVAQGGLKSSMLSPFDFKASCEFSRPTLYAHARRCPKIRWRNDIRNPPTPFFTFKMSLQTSLDTLCRPSCLSLLRYSPKFPMVTAATHTHK